MSFPLVLEVVVEPDPANRESAAGKVRIGMLGLKASTSPADMHVAARCVQQTRLRAGGIGFGHGAAIILSSETLFAALFALGRRGGKAPEGLSLAIYLALGIGLHNLGEGLAIGASFAIGEAALGSFLVVGFTLHNLTEGIGIAAPLTKQRVNLVTFLALGALAGGAVERGGNAVGDSDSSSARSLTGMARSSVFKRSLESRTCPYCRWN